MWRSYAFPMMLWTPFYILNTRWIKHIHTDHYGLIWVFITRIAHAFRNLYITTVCIFGIDFELVPYKLDLEHDLIVHLRYSPESSEDFRLLSTTQDLPRNQDSRDILYSLTCLSPYLIKSRPDCENKFGLSHHDLKTIIFNSTHTAEINRPLFQYIWNSYNLHSILRQLLHRAAISVSYKTVLSSILVTTYYTHCYWLINDIIGDWRSVCGKYFA